MVPPKNDPHQGLLVALEHPKLSKLVEDPNEPGISHLQVCLTYACFYRNTYTYMYM